MVNWSARCAPAPPGRPSARVLLAVELIACLTLVAPAHTSVRPAPPPPPRARMIVLALPGATLDDIDDPQLQFLPRLIRGAAGAWVAAWRPPDLAALRAAVPAGALRRDPARPYGVMADEGAIRRAIGAALATHALIWVDPGD